MRYARQRYVAVTSVESRAALPRNKCVDAREVILVDARELEAHARALGVHVVVAHLAHHGDATGGQLDLHFERPPDRLRGAEEEAAAHRDVAAAAARRTARALEHRERSALEARVLPILLPMVHHLPN